MSIFCCANNERSDLYDHNNDVDADAVYNADDAVNNAAADDDLGATGQCGS